MKIDISVNRGGEGVWECIQSHSGPFGTVRAMLRSVVLVMKERAEGWSSRAE